MAANFDENAGIRPGYKLKLNSHDLGVDIELNDALNRIRFEHPEVRTNEPDIGLWLVRETLGFLRQTLSRLDVSSRSLFALVDEGSCFAGTLLELALACDRIYTLNLPDNPNAAPGLTLSQANLPIGLHHLPWASTKLGVHSAFLGQHPRPGGHRAALVCSPPLHQPAWAEETGQRQSESLVAGSSATQAYSSHDLGVTRYAISIRPLNKL